MDPTKGTRTLLRQKYILIACCTIHNDFRNKSMIIEDTQNLSANLKSNIIELDVSLHHLREMAQVRDDIANQIWATFEG